MTPGIFFIKTDLNAKNIIMSKRRDFLKAAGLTGLALAQGSMLPASAFGEGQNNKSNDVTDLSEDNDAGDLSIIGLYGPWADALRQNQLPSLSFRRPAFTNVD